MGTRLGLAFGCVLVDPRLCACKGLQNIIRCFPSGLLTPKRDEVPACPAPVPSNAHATRTLLPRSPRPQFFWEIRIVATQLAQDFRSPNYLSHPWETTHRACEVLRLVAWLPFSLWARLGSSPFTWRLPLCGCPPPHTVPSHFTRNPYLAVEVPPPHQPLALLRREVSHVVVQVGLEVACGADTRGREGTACVGDTCHHAAALSAHLDPVMRLQRQPLMAPA